MNLSPLVVAVLLAAALPAEAASLRGTEPLDASAPSHIVVLQTFSQTLPVADPHRLGPGGRAPDPLDASTGHAMWDPLGAGCIDGGGEDDPFPVGKGALRAAPFCLAQPCARSLTEEELSFQVVGRPLRPGEWDTYVTRYAEACRQDAVWPVERPVPEWVALVGDDEPNAADPVPAGPVTASLSPGGGGRPVAGGGTGGPLTSAFLPRPRDDRPRDDLPPPPGSLDDPRPEKVFPEPPPPVVPLPPALPLFAAALATGLVFGRRRG